MRLAAAAVVAALAALVHADLPSHCCSSQVFGEWTLYFGDATGNSGLTCGHSLPDQPMVMVNRKNSLKNPGFQVASKAKWILHEPKKTTGLHNGLPVTDASGKPVGYWTMVYDEGFELNVNGYRYTSFFQYSPKFSGASYKQVADFNTNCQATYSGWYRPTTSSTSNWGCFIASRTDSKEPIYVPSGTLSSGAPVLSPGMRFHTRHSAYGRQRTLAPHEFFSKPVFEYDSAFIELHNSNAQASWTAAAHPHLHGRPMSHIKAMLGHGRKAPRDMFAVDHSHTRFFSDAHLSALREKVATLPTSLNWATVNDGMYATPVVDQGSCGSCWAIATTDALTMRMRIKKRLPPHATLATQAALSCSVLNQACDGGYPYLGGAYSYDIGYVTTDCLKYNPYSPTCPASVSCPAAQGGSTQILALLEEEQTTESAALRGHSTNWAYTGTSTSAFRQATQNYFKSTGYRYVGGFYGAGNHDDMIVALQAGPIPVAFEAPEDLTAYASGVYNIPQAHDASNYYMRWPGSRWLKTNHAVTCVGYGVDTRHGPYWVLKNSWGASWGDNGYFKVARVVNDRTASTFGGLLGIQSMPVEVYA